MGGNGATQGREMGFFFGMRCSICCHQSETLQCRTRGSFQYISQSALNSAPRSVERCIVDSCVLSQLSTFFQSHPICPRPFPPNFTHFPHSSHQLFELLRFRPLAVTWHRHSHS